MGHDDTEAAAWAMESWGESRGGGVEEDVGGGGADEESAGLAPGGGSGGGAAGESHFVPNTGRKDGMIMPMEFDETVWQAMAGAASSW